MKIRRIELPLKVKRPILACGADLKGAFAFSKGREAFLVDGFGDLGDLDNFTKYKQAVRKYLKKFGVKPRVIVCDLHPNYFSTRFAEELQSASCDSRLYQIQHHEAHIASAIVDNDIKSDVIGVAFDGTGYGSDGNIWGGEFFVGGLKGFKRAAHLGYIPMPGGDKAIREPWRMAVSYLYHAYGKKVSYCSSEGKIMLLDCARRIILPESRTSHLCSKDIEVVLAMIDKRINSPLTSSAGRLFDAVGSLVLAKDIVSKEAELPIELERLLAGGECGKYKFEIHTKEGKLVIGTASIIKGVVEDLAKKKESALMSCKFHNTMADIILKISLKLSKEFKVRKVVLSGGVFQNRYLTAKTADGLRENGLEAYIHSGISTNDSGIPIGQIAIANARATCV